MDDQLQGKDGIRCSQEERNEQPLRKELVTGKTILNTFLGIMVFFFFTLVFSTIINYLILSTVR